MQLSPEAFVSDSISAMQSVQNSNFDTASVRTSVIQQRFVGRQLVSMPSPVASSQASVSHQITAQSLHPSPVLSMLPVPMPLDLMPAQQQPQQQLVQPPSVLMSVASSSIPCRRLCGVGSWS